MKEERKPVAYDLATEILNDLQIIKDKIANVCPANYEDWTNVSNMSQPIEIASRYIKELRESYWH